MHEENFINLILWESCQSFTGYYIHVQRFAPVHPESSKNDFQIMRLISAQMWMS